VDDWKATAVLLAARLVISPAEALASANPAVDDRIKRSLDADAVAVCSGNEAAMRVRKKLPGARREPYLASEEVCQRAVGRRDQGRKRARRRDRARGRHGAPRDVGRARDLDCQARRLTGASDRGEYARSRQHSARGLPETQIRDDGGARGRARAGVARRRCYVGATGASRCACVVG